MAFTNLTADANETNPPAQSVTVQEKGIAITPGGQVTSVSFELVSTATNPQYALKFAIDGGGAPIIAGQTIPVVTKISAGATLFGNYDETASSTSASKSFNLTGGTITIDSISSTSLSMHGTVTIAPAILGGPAIGSFTANFTVTGMPLPGA